MVVDGDGREVLALAPDELMPAASVIKLPLVMTLFADAAAGDPLVARPLLGLLGRGAAEIAGAELGGLPPEVGGTA